MENFTVKINCIKRGDDGKLMVVFDVLVAGNKVGEAQSEYAVFNGVLMGKLHECMVNTQSESLKVLMGTP